MDILFGSAPSVKNTTQATISPTQENIINAAAGYLQSGAPGPGVTPGAPADLGEIAPGLSDLQNLSLSGYSNLFTNIIPSLLSQFNPVGSAQAATNAFTGALGYQGPGTVTPSDVTAGIVSPGAPVSPTDVTAGTVAAPSPVQLPGGPAPVTAGQVAPSQVTAPQATAAQLAALQATAPQIGAPQNIAAPNVTAPQVDIGRAIQQGVVAPAQQLWGQTLLPGIIGQYGKGAGGAFSSDAEQARLQAGEQLETGVEAQSSALEQQLQAQNLAAQLQTQGLNVGGALQAATANQQAALSAALANQQTGLSANLANLQAGTTTGLANQQTGLSASLANQQAALTAALANQQTGAQTGEFNVGGALQAALANQGAGLQEQQLAAQLAQFNAQLPAQIGEFNVGTALQGSLANQQQALAAALANQQTGLQAGEFNVGTGLQAGLANQQAGLQAGGLNISSGLGTQNAILQALGQAPNIANLPYAGPANLAGLLTSGINAGNIPYNVQLTADQMQQQLAQLPFQQTNQRLALATGLALGPTQQTTSVVNPGQTGLIPSLLGSIGSGFGKGVGSNPAVGTALASLLPV